jgi:hypothetical protein
MTSSSKPSELFSSDLLLKVAPPAFKEMIDCAKNKKPLPSAFGSRIGTTLLLIEKQLEVMQPFQLPATAQHLSHRALQDLLKLCKGAQPAS